MLPLVATKLETVPLVAVMSDCSKPVTPSLNVAVNGIGVVLVAVPADDVTLTLGPARPQILVCNDPVLGIVGNSVLGM